jgi:hypothetical protein
MENLEFKVYDWTDGGNLSATVLTALKQIVEKNYSTSLIDEGFLKENIRAYGFAFEGKTVLIDGGDLQKVNLIIKTAEEKKAARKVLAKKKTAKRKCR